MAKLKIKGKDLIKLGFPESRAIGVALKTVRHHFKQHSKDKVLYMLKSILADPEGYLQDEIFKEIAAELIRAEKIDKQFHELSDDAGQYKTYGTQHIEPGAVRQMETAMRLPVAVAGALMPDAHQGYGLPIGGVLATDNAVIPYGVGVDIGCRMCLSVYDLPAAYLEEQRSGLKRILHENTRFGFDEFSHPLEDEIMDRKEFSEIPVARQLKDRAFRQLGSSGSGNHFVEFGLVEIKEWNDLGLSPGIYLGLLSHSGSRGLGANIARHYTRIAMELCQLPKEAKHLAWLDLETEEGAEYWAAMNLAGDYASACHAQIHRRVNRALGSEIRLKIENHHNFAWRETLEDGRSVIVHRKGATPAGKGVLGIIPGSMTAPGFIVQGKGVIHSVNSASHGAGRTMSRTMAKSSISQKEFKQHLQKYQVDLIGGNLDEAPMAYKDIHQVMAAQRDLVDILGSFWPKIVRMAG